MIPKIIHWWFSPKLPERHIFIERRPRGLASLLRVYSRNWFVHPISRHLAHWYMQVLKLRGCKVIGITGSAGKTTTKEMVFSVLSQKYKTVKTPASIDPVYNIPSTILSTSFLTERLVLEMSIEYPGEMEYYTWLARPDLAVVTNVSRVHSEFLGDVDDIAKEKGNIVEALTDGWAVLNADDTRVFAMQRRTSAKILLFSKRRAEPIFARNIKITKEFKTEFQLLIKNESIDVSLPVLGEHFVVSALAAASVGYISQVALHSIKEGLESFSVPPHRMQPIKLKRGAVLIDDSYNANPYATISSIKTLMTLPGKRKILVLADMKELGKFEESGHRSVGRALVTQGVDYLFVVGDAVRFVIDAAAKKGMSKRKIFYAKNKKEMVAELDGFLKKGDVVLVKGSRSMHLEEVVGKMIRYT